MFAWLQSIGRGILPFCLGVMLAGVVLQWSHMQDQVNLMKERLPEVLEHDAQQLPPGAINLRGLGNRWILFEMEVHNDKKTFLFRRGHYRDQPDILTQIK